MCNDYKFSPQLLNARDIPLSYSSRAEKSGSSYVISRTSDVSICGPPSLLHHSREDSLVILPLIYNLLASLSSSASQPAVRHGPTFIVRQSPA